MNCDHTIFSSQDVKLSSKAVKLEEFFQHLPNKSRICLRCIQRFLFCRGKQRDTAVRDANGDEEAELLEMAKEDTNSVPSLSFCSLCLGLLDESQLSKFASQVTKHVHDQDYDSETFSFNLAIPHLLQIRKHSFLTYVKDFASEKEYSNFAQIPVKDSIKEVLVPIIEKKIGKKFNIKGDLQVNVTFSHPEGQKEEESILKRSLSPALKRRKIEKNDVSWNQLSGALEELSTSSQFSRLYPCPPERLDVPCGICSISTSCSSVYVGGRYNKYSRELSQTPWVVDGKRHGTTSVQELLCNPIQEALIAEDVKFMSSGREDVDVRMLGKGRPFAAEFTNPKRIKLTSEHLKVLEESINSSTKDIRIGHLQFVSREDLKVLKQGEEEKTKSYKALIYAPDGIPEESLHKLATVKDIVLEQKTPIRVLHRRPLSVREKTVFKMSAEKIDDYHFHLTLTTQAGTYVKEFVHGDFGRTVPSLGTIVGQETDILELDVTEVDLPWPPLKPADS